MIIWNFNLRKKKCWSFKYIYIYLLLHNFSRKLCSRKRCQCHVIELYLLMKLATRKYKHKFASEQPQAITVIEFRT